MKRTIVIVAISAALVLSAAVYAYWPRLTNRPRRIWKDQAIEQVRHRVADEQWLSAETDRVKAQPRSFEGGWFSDELLLMKNGDWMVAQHMCSKQEPLIKDIFIGRGSDGRWYYSTFHFCVGLDVLHMEPQPKSLAEFVRGFWLVPFDGKSDDCLEQTWTSEPYGQFLLNPAIAKPQ